MANVPKTVAPAKELWARLRKTFFVERWRRSIHGLDLLRCFTADELRTALRHPRTREQTLDVGKSVTIEGDAKDLRVIVVLSGSLKVYLRSAEVTVDGRTKRASNPLIDASRLSYNGGVTSIGSRSGETPRDRAEGGDARARRVRSGARDLRIHAGAHGEKVG